MESVPPFEPGLDTLAIFAALEARLAWLSEPDPRYPDNWVLRWKHCNPELGDLWRRPDAISAGGGP